MEKDKLSLDIALFWINVVQAFLYIIASVFVGMYIADSGWITGIFLSVVFIVLAYGYARKASNPV